MAYNDFAVRSAAPLHLRSAAHCIKRSSIAFVQQLTTLVHLADSLRSPGR
jgi:secreted trypsin-like serine protease